MSDIFGLSGLPDLLPSDAENLADKSDEALGRDHLSHSEVSELMACGQKYGFSREMKLEPIAYRPALSMGKAFQEAIEYGDPDKGYDAIIADRTVRNQEDENARTIEATVVRAASRLYLQKYPAQEKSQKEFGYRVRLRNPFTGSYSRTFDLLGYADELAEESGSLVVTENKFVGQISALSIRKLPLDRQVALECYGIWRATGREVEKVRYRWTRKPSIRPRKGEATGDFCARLERDYASRPEFYLHEEVLYRSTADLVRIEAELWEWANSIREGRKRNLWARNTSHCQEYGGCAFMPICLGDPDAGSLYQRKSNRITKGINDPATR